MIYFIRNAFRSAIKIGYASSMRGVGRRLHTLRTANVDALEVIAVIDGTIKDEKALHARFKSLRRRGEWFYDDPSIREFIASENDLYERREVKRQEKALRITKRLEVVTLKQVRDRERLERRALRKQEKNRQRREKKQSTRVPRVLKQWTPPIQEELTCPICKTQFTRERGNVKRTECSERCRRGAELLNKLLELSEKMRVAENS